jgi:hypothetical protein
MKKLGAGFEIDTRKLSKREQEDLMYYLKHNNFIQETLNLDEGAIKQYTGSMKNAKYYWKIFNKKQKIDFLVGAGYSKSVANDLSNEDWDSLEFGVHKNLASVLENLVNESNPYTPLQ